MTLLQLENLSVTRGTRRVVDDISLSIAEGECVGLIGPNGSGKTTLMRAALGLLPHAGRSSLTALDAGARAKACAWMPQSRDIAWPVSVETVVTLGRIPHLPKRQKPGEIDRNAVAEALDRMGLSQMRSRTATHLSGGEQARVLIARALAQQTPLVMADEPIAGLDPAGQIETMRVFRQVAESGRAVLVSLHDLGLAARHCSRLVLLNNGRLIATGAPSDVLTPENVRQVFGVSAYFTNTEQGPVFQPMEVL